MSPSLSSTTMRIYEAQQRRFIVWCDQHNIEHPARPKHVAAFLRHIAATSGPTAVRPHLSAIGNLYRSANWPLDTKTPIIQTIVRNCSRRTGRHPSP